jgi:ArsR family transcriptional regulator, arsenate/arsenite/antimonite-responsive transcriptional repressor
MSHFRALVGSDADSESDPAARFLRRAGPPDAQLDRIVQFDNSRYMESKTVVGALGALAQDSRLQVYRLLVQAGPEGMAASEIAGRLCVPANTLSFHLKTLSHAGLVLSRQKGRFIYYSANYEQMNALLGFLTENCCGGRSCVTGAAPRKRRVS